MTIKEKVAKAVAVVSLKMAKVSCGAASQFLHNRLTVLRLSLFVLH